MTFTQYVPLALRTESPKNPFAAHIDTLGLNFRLFHGIEGLNTEVVEILEAYDKADEENTKIDVVNLSEEVGDLFWYLAIMANVLGLEKEIQEMDDDKVFKEINIDIAPLKLSILSGQMLDMTKKTMFYHKDFDIDKLKGLYFKMYSQTVNYLDNLGKRDSWITRENTREINIEKLLVRFPDKFTDVDAEIRDLVKERKILEKKSKKHAHTFS